MNTHRRRLSSVSVSLFIGASALAGCGFFAPKPASGPAPEPSPKQAAAAPADLLPSSEPVSSARPRIVEEVDDKPKVFKLDGHGLPLSIEVPHYSEVEAWTLDEAGGAKIGSQFYKVSVHVYKPGAKLKTLAAAKITRKKMSGCDAYPLVKEEADYLVFDCKMRSMHTHQFLMLKDVGGVTYACESENHAATVADLEESLAACRTLKPL